MSSVFYFIWADTSDLIKDPITTISRKLISNIWKQQDSEQLKLQSENVVSLKSSGLDEHQWEIFKKRVLAMGAADNWGIGCCSNSNIRWQITTSSRWPSVSPSASSVISPSFLRCSVTGRYICMHSPHTFSPAFSHTLPPPPPPQDCGPVILIEILQGDPRQRQTCQSRPFPVGSQSKTRTASKSASTVCC